MELFRSGLEGGYGSFSTSMGKSIKIKYIKKIPHTGDTALNLSTDAGSSTNTNFFLFFVFVFRG